MLFDVSNPSQPEFPIAYSPQGWHERVYQINWASHRIYITHRDEGLLFYDITDPENAQVGDLFRLEGASGMTQKDNLFYVTSLKGTLHVFDITGNEFVNSRRSLVLIARGDWSTTIMPSCRRQHLRSGRGQH